MAGQTVTVTAEEHRKNKANGTSGSSGSTSNINSGGTYDKNKDYAAEIQKAINSGASQDVINQLNAERNAKIKGENLNYSGLTDNDFMNYKNTGNFNGTKSNISQDNYGIGQDGGNASNRFSYNPSDSQIRNLQQSIDYDGTKGYADPTGYYTTRQTAFTWEQPDGTYKTTYSNATNYNQALHDAIASGQVAPNSQLAHSSTYGTGSLTGNGYNYGRTSAGDGLYSGFGNGTDGGRYTADNQYGNMYDQTNMQLGFLSGRDGMDYKNPYADIAYNGNGIQNAYNKGLQFAGQGELMGGSADPNNPTTPNLNDIYSQYGANTNGYVGLTKDDIRNQMDDIYANYEDAVAERNAALSSQYREQQRLLENDNEKQQRANYIHYMLSLNNAPSQMQAMGINGGVAESTLAGLKSDYMSNYNSAENTFTNAVNQLKISEANALAEGNMEKANMYSQLAQNSLSLQMQAADAQNSYNKWLAEFNLTKEQWAYQKTQDEANRLASIQQAQDELTYKTAEWAYKIGDYDLLGATLGMDTSYLKQQRDLEAKYNQAKYEGQLLTNQGRKLTNSKKANGSSKRNSTSGNNSNTAADTVTTGGQTSSVTPALDWVRNKLSSNGYSNPTTNWLQKTSGGSNSSSNKLTGYASGVYSDLAKSGYSPTQMDEAITREYNKGYITKAEADILASKLIG